MIPILAALLALASPEAERDAERLVGLLDYVAGDYAGAVRDGRVVAEAEYREQVSFVADARSLARSLGAPDDGLARLGALVDARAPADEVAHAARAERDAMVRRLGVTILPARPASRERAATLFRQLCTKCHGEQGGGDGPEAARLDPRPRAFADPAFLLTASPRRGYHALTYGLPGTAMASFEALPAQDRLALAFYVFTFHHGGGKAEPVDVSLREAALRTDGELRARVGERGLAWLRARAPWEAPDPIEESRRLARAAASAAVRSPDEARRLALDAYLDGFEAAEARLRARDAKLVADVEGAFLDFRAAIDRRDPAAGAERLSRLLTLLERADATLAASAPRGAVAFFASFVIFAREGAEAALLVAALLAVLRRSGRRDLARPAHAGWIAAIGAGLLTWWISSELIRGIAASREAIEGVVSLLAAAVLFYVSFWLLARADSRRWLAYLRAQADRGAARGGAAFLFGVAFLAAYREAFETVLFYRALLSEAAADRAAIVAGIAAGAAAVVAFAWAFARAGARLPLGAFFGASGLLLVLLAIAFAGAGLHELRAAGLLGAHPVRVPAIPWLGVHGDWVGLCVQGAMLAAVVAAGVALLVRRARDANLGRCAAPASGPGSSRASPS